MTINIHLETVLFKRNMSKYRPASKTNPTQDATNALPPAQLTTEYPTLSDFMQQLENYESTIPDAVTSHYLNTAGFDTNDPRIVRLISIATQKFIADIANDTLQHSQMRTNQQNDTQKAIKINKDRKYTMTIDDLIPSLADYGITVRKAQYFS